MPKISVILTSYNHEKYIREAIDSVLAQTFTDFELIIWDDASSDESWAIINSYSDPRIKAFQNDETRRGVYGINKAIKGITSGEYIAIHHSDDVWEKEKLAKQVEFLDGHPEVGAVFTKALAIGEDGKPLNDPEHFYSNIFDQQNQTKYQWLNYFFYHGNALCHPSVLIRRQCYQDCGLYRFGLAQLGDFDMWVRLCLKYEIHVLPDRLVRFRIRENEANASGIRPETQIRTATEFSNILMNFLRIESFEEMVAIFPKATEYFRADGFEPKFVLSMIALGHDTHHWAKVFGIEQLFYLIGDTIKAKEIKLLYNFDYRDLVFITGKYDLFSQTALGERDAALGERDAALGERDAALGERDAALGERDAALGERDAALGERDAALGERDAALGERDAALGERDAALGERDAALGERDAALGERDDVESVLVQVLNSKSWRFTSPYRWCGNQLKNLYRFFRSGFSNEGVFDLKERLHKVLCFWRNHGTKALIHLVLFKLKTKDTPTVACSPDPEVRPATGKRVDTITKGGADGITALRFEACSPLRVYLTPAGKPARISIVTDSINGGSLYGGVGTAMIMAALLAEARHARLRVITRTESARSVNLAHVLETYGINLSHDVEFVFAPFYDRRYEIDIFNDELFITTSWWTTAATMASVQHDSIIYLLQEDERMFYSYGDDHLRCAQVLRSRDIRFVINTRLLFDHLVADGLDNIAEKSIWFEPAFPKEVFYPRARKNSNKRTLMFYARPNNLRNLFYFGIELIDAAITRGIIDLAKWDILLVGKDIPDVFFAGNYAPEKCENLSWAEYAELVGKMDLGLCLMYTPHPSYPPLDLAASGAVVVTNRFGNKRDLINYSRNIVCGNLDQESMIAALAQGLNLATSTTERDKNHRSSALGSDWQHALSDVVQRFAEVR